MLSSKIEYRYDTHRKLLPFAHDSSVAVAPSSSPCGLGAYNKVISDFANAPSKFHRSRSETSDTPQPLNEIRISIQKTEFFV
jgi:hypothetical protein